MSVLMWIGQGSWIARQSVGSTPCLLGKAVDCNYIREPKYLEVMNFLYLVKSRFVNCSET